VQSVGLRCMPLAVTRCPAARRFPRQEHIERLVNSAKVFALIWISRVKKSQGHGRNHRHNAVWPCYIRPIVLRGYGEAGVNPLNSPTEIYIINYPWEIPRRRERRL